MHLYNLVKVVILSCVLSISTCVENEYLNPEWIDPHAWSNDQDPLSKLCPKSEPCKTCEKDAKTEYLRLVNTLFDPSQFRFDESTNYLYRTVHIHVTKQQLDNLRKSKDITHIDGLISDILSQTQFGTVQLVKEFTIDVVTTIWDRFPTFDYLPRSKPILINFSLLVLSYFLCRRYNVSFLIAIFFTTLYFLYEYLDYECHKRIDLDEQVDFIYGAEKNPCSGVVKDSWMDWFLRRDSKTLCRDYLAKQVHAKNQCGIVDLFHEFTTNIVLKQLKLFIISVSELIRSINATNGILITAVTLYFMKDILTTIIHSVFKFILNPTIWSRVVADMSPRVPEENTTSRQRRLVQETDSSDLRDSNLSKALDLANTQMKLLLKQNAVPSITDVEPSSVELLFINDTTVDEAISTPKTIMNKIGSEIPNEKISKVNDTAANNSDSFNESSGEDISVFVVDRSRSKSQEFPSKNENLAELSDKSLDSEFSNMSDDVELISDFHLDTNKNGNSQ